MAIIACRTLRVLIILLVLSNGVFCSAPLQAADCSPEDIELNSQAQVDSFQSTYGPCDRVAGKLKIEGDDIADLSGLSGLNNISQFTVSQNPLLKDLQGLSSITSMGTVFITYNEGLESFDGLDALEQLGSLLVRGNSSLRSMQGLSSLHRVGGGEFRIAINDSLESLDGLESLETVVGELVIEDNDSLLDIDALSSLSEVTIEPTYSIRIQRNRSLANLDGLASLTKVPGSLIIHLNDSLADIDGLSNLAEVGAWLHIAANHELTEVDGLRNLAEAGSLGLVNNAKLQGVDGLSGLIQVRGVFEISWNPALSNLSGLASMTTIGTDQSMFSGLRIEGNATLPNLNGLSGLHVVYGDFVLLDNPSLRDCQGVVTLVDPIDDFEPGPGSSGIPDLSEEPFIQGNLRGCNSVKQVLGMAPLAWMNAGLNDAWFNPQTSGQGFLITVFPEIKQIFMAWFTFDTERPPADVTSFLGEPGHRWLTAQGEYEENVAELALYVTAGGVFDSAQPAAITDPYGEIMLDFSSCNAGMITYDIPSIDRQGSVPIERITLDNVPLCYVLNQQASQANPSNE